MPDLSQLGAATAGIWTRPQALGLLTRGSVQAQIHSGAWQVVFPGVYADGGYALSAVQWAFACVLASGFRSVDLARTGPVSQLVAAACGRTAARVWGFPLIDDHDPATGALDSFVHDVHLWRQGSNLTVPVRPGDQRAHQLRRHRLTLIAGEIVEHPSGLWLTSPLRTALDAPAFLGHEAAVCLMDYGLHREMFTEEDLRQGVGARAGWPGVQALSSAVAAADARAESPNETLARLLLLPALPGLVPQVRLRARSGQVIARFDLGDEDLKLAVDMDGKRGHAGELMVAKDRQRDRRTEAYGWWTERGTWFEVRRRQEEFVNRVLARAALLRRRAS